MTLPVEDAEGVVEGGVVDDGVVEEGATTGVDGCSMFANPGLIWISLDIDGARLVLGRPDCAAAVNGVTAAVLLGTVGAAMLLREDIDSGLTEIGAIVGPSTDAGVLFDGLSDPVEDAVVGRIPAVGRLEFALTEGLGSEVSGALAVAEVGFFVSLW